MPRPVVPIARHGLRLADLSDPDRLADKLAGLVDLYDFMLRRYFHQPGLDLAEIAEEAARFGAELKPLFADVTGELHDCRRAGKRVLFEGAQGSLLDIDHGTYPYVTSSNTTVGGVMCGTGVGPGDIDYVLGITKAYTTRVGGGPFPTELDDADGRLMAKRGVWCGSTVLVGFA